MTNKKKIIIGAAAAILVAVAAILFFIFRGISFGGDGDNVAYVQSVKSLSGYDMAVDRYAGVVEAQTAINYKKDTSRTIEEVYVKVGDTVNKGTPLFKYDVRTSENSIASIQLDIESLNNDIAYLQTQGNSTDIQLQISERQLEIKQKQADLKRYQQEIEQAEVLSEIAGLVKAVNSKGEDASGNEIPVVTISEIGEYRVKGNVSEQSISTLSAGLPVVIRSRVDETQTWKGTISKIEAEPQSNNNNDDMFYYGGGERSSTYPFYVTMGTTNGLMLGQHVFIEPDYGQSDAVAKEGVWIEQSFIVSDDGDSSYVWVDKNGRLDKRAVQTGEVDESDFTIKIENGLTEDDLIAWPDDTLREGMKTVDIAEAE